MLLGALGPCVRLARQGSGVQTAPRARRAGRMAPVMEVEQLQGRVRARALLVGELPSRPLPLSPRHNVMRARLGFLDRSVPHALRARTTARARTAARTARMAHACANPPEIRRQIVPLASMAATAALAHLGIMDQRVQAALLNVESTEPVLMACRVMAAAAAILGSQAIPARNARLA